MTFLVHIFLWPKIFLYPFKYIIFYPCQVWRSITSWCSPILWLTRFSRIRCSTCWSSSVKSHSTRPWCSPTSTQGIVWCFHIDPRLHGCCCWSLSPRKVHLSEAFALDGFWISTWHSLDLIHGELKMCPLGTAFFILLWLLPQGSAPGRHPLLQRLTCCLYLRWECVWKSSYLCVECCNFHNFIIYFDSERKNIELFMVS